MTPEKAAEAAEWTMRLLPKMNSDQCSELIRIFTRYDEPVVAVAVRRYVANVEHGQFLDLNRMKSMLDENDRSRISSDVRRAKVLSDEAEKRNRKLLEEAKTLEEQTRIHEELEALPAETLEECRRHALAMMSPFACRRWENRPVLGNAVLENLVYAELRRSREPQCA